MQIVVNNYHGDDLSWLPEGDVTVYDKKDLNVGYNIYDYLDWITKNYNNLPDLVLFTKGNMLQRHITLEEWDKIKNNKTFTPILTQNHKTDGIVNYYKDGLYYETNDSWYFHSYESKYYKKYEDFARDFDLPSPSYLGFAPGACYIVPKENILKRDVLFYDKLKALVSWTKLPAEAHVIERSLYNLWL